MVRRLFLLIARQPHPRGTLHGLLSIAAEQLRAEGGHIVIINNQLGPESFNFRIGKVQVLFELLVLRYDAARHLALSLIPLVTHRHRS
jgi:hypothetical protein